MFMNIQKKRNTYIRIRNEGKQITMTYKEKLNQKFPVEREVEIDSFKEGEAILLSLGCKLRYGIEKLRETYSMKGAKEIVFDSYPGLPTYMEIDCHSLADLKRVAGKLGYKISDHDKTGPGDLYELLYGIKKVKKVVHYYFQMLMKKLDLS